MPKLIINSYDEFEAFVGKELGVSDYHTITQEQINKFADATLDHQWIHVDHERAKQKVHTGPPLPTDISACPCSPICGIRLSR